MCFSRYGIDAFYSFVLSSNCFWLNNVSCIIYYGMFRSVLLFYLQQIVKFIGDVLYIFPWLDK